MARQGSATIRRRRWIPLNRTVLAFFESVYPNQLHIGIALLMLRTPPRLLDFSPSRPHRATWSTSFSPTISVTSSMALCFILDLPTILLATRYRVGQLASMPTSLMLLQFPEVQRTKMVTPLEVCSFVVRFSACCGLCFRVIYHLVVVLLSITSKRPRDVCHSFPILNQSLLFRTTLFYPAG